LPRGCGSTVVMCCAEVSNSESFSTKESYSLKRSTYSIPLSTMHQNYNPKQTGRRHRGLLFASMFEISGGTSLHSSHHRDQSPGLYSFLPLAKYYGVFQNGSPSPGAVSLAASVSLGAPSPPHCTRALMTGHQSTAAANASSTMPHST